MNFWNLPPDAATLGLFPRLAGAPASALPLDARRELPVDGRALEKLQRLGTRVLLLSAFAFASQPARTETQPDAARLEFFEKKVRPVLASHCYICHSADTKPAGGLRVDDRNGLLTGGEGGPAVVPGDPEKSLLLKRIKHTDPKRRMPKEGELISDAQFADLTQWIKDGAAWPPERVPASLGRVRADYEELRAKHWAFQPLTHPVVPTVKQARWAETPVDRFILAKLEAQRLAPVADAAPATLIRRVTLDLTGLPPTPEEVSAFVKDPSPKAYARVVDRLLASQAFGERWGRYWLDVARYGESTGPSRNIPYPHAWKYRDYVIDSLNRDLPFDRFIQEQIAGDLLPAATPAERDHLNTATGFLALGVKDVNQRFKVRFLMDNVDEQIDAVSRAVLGLTVSCARCHDHKFDPVPIKDYYALAGIFTSTDNAAGVRNKMGGGGLDYYDPAMLIKLSADALPPVPQEKLDKLKADLAVAKKAWDEIRGTPEGLKLAANGQPTQRPFRLKYEALQTELASLTDPVSRGYAVHGVRDAAVIRDTEVRIRGEAERLGPVVPRGFLTAFAVPGAATITTTNHSGRLELAQWLTHPANPLTPRVIANRVWSRLFGQGIVSTVDNFGVNGAPPTHPELLDHLAAQLVKDGWSLKQLIRSLALSHAYRLGSGATPDHQKLDPANSLVWRHSPRRLEAEEFRDAVLAASGQLTPSAPGGSPAKELKMIEMRDNGAEARTIHEHADRAHYRSVYLPLLRGVVPKSLEAFDPVEQALVTGKREATTVPTQALFLLNSSFIRQQSLALAERVLTETARSGADQIRRAYLLTVGRTPTQREVAQAKEFITHYERAYLAERPTQAPASAAPKAEPTAEAKPAATPVNPDDVERTSELPPDENVEARSAKSAAWMSFVQALYASAEFRFVR